MVCFLFLAIIIGGCVYFVISGVRQSSCALLVLGYGVLVAIVIGAGLMSSDSSYGSMFAYLIAIIAAPTALVGGIISAVVLKKRQKLHGAWIGILFPILLFGSIMIGSEFAPESLSVEDQYLKYTEEVLDTIQAPEPPPSLYHITESYPDCIAYLKENLPGQYSLEVLTAIDPYRDYAPTGSTAALILVEFPGGEQVELSYYNFTLETCKVIEGD